MLCVLCLIVLWGFSLVTSYSGVNYGILGRCFPFFIFPVLHLSVVRFPVRLPSNTKHAGKGFCDGAVVPFERLWMSLVF